MRQKTLLLIQNSFQSIDEKNVLIVKKDMNCFVYDGGAGEYGVYIVCDDCDKLEFEWKYEGY